MIFRLARLFPTFRLVANRNNSVIAAIAIGNFDFVAKLLVLEDTDIRTFCNIEEY